MTTLEERIALLEERLRQLDQAMNGGGSVEWKRSIRGRMHDVENELDAARLAKAALEEVRRSQQRTWTSRERRLALSIAAVGLLVPIANLALTLHAHG